MLWELPRPKSGHGNNGGCDRAMTDDTTSITTVGDEGAAMALSHPPFFLKSFKRLRFPPIGGA